MEHQCDGCGEEIPEVDWNPRDPYCYTCLHHRYVDGVSLDEDTLDEIIDHSQAQWDQYTDDALKERQKLIDFARLKRRRK